MGLSLPMASSIWGADGRLLGVAGFDTTFDYVADSLLPPAGRPEVDDAYLIDDHGDVVVHWSRAGKTTDARAHKTERAGDAPIPLSSFPDRALLERAARENSGMIELPGGKIAVYESLSSLGWTYVVVADEARLLAR